MTERYKGLLIDSCPQRRGWLRWQLGSPLSLVAPGSGPMLSRTPAKLFPLHAVTCLIRSCSLADAFPISQAYVLLYPVCQLNPPFHLAPCLFLVIIIQHNVTQHWPFFFPCPLIILCAYSHPKHACVHLCVSPSLSSNGAARWFVSRRCQSNSCGSPDTSVSVSSVEARGNEALPIYWSLYTPLCIRETLFSLPNRNIAPSIPYSTPARHQLFSPRSAASQEACDRLH